MTDTDALSYEQAMRDAYAAHAGELYGFANRCLGDSALAEEAVQETFLRAWRAVDRFDPKIGSRRTWLFAIARNVIIDSSRSRAAHRVEPPVEVEHEHEHEPLEQALLAWQVEEALRRIGDAHRQILIETHFRARPYSEVAS